MIHSLSAYMLHNKRSWKSFENATVDCSKKSTKNTKLPKIRYYSLQKENTEFISPWPSLKKEHTHLLLTPFYNISAGVISSIYFLQHPFAVLKTKGKKCIFPELHVSEALVLQMGDFVHQRSQNPTCGTTQNKFYWASSEQSAERNWTSTNPMEGAASNSEYGKVQPIKVLPEQTSFTVSSRSLLFICVKTTIKLLYLLLCL